MKTYNELRADVIDRANKDEDFRARLFSDPKSAVKEATGLDLPDSVDIEVHEESATTAHLVLPPTGRLDEQNLEQIAAGDNSNMATAYQGRDYGHSHPHD